MGRKLCVALLVLCVAAVVVKSETTIEVDENGDEYEVKRFNIEGRSLHEGRSQCVVSRRKRATASAEAAAAAMVSDDSSDEPSDEQSDEMEMSSMRKGPKGAMVQTTETANPSQIDTDTETDESDYDDAGADQPMNVLVHHQAIVHHDVDDDEDDSDYDDEDDAAGMEVNLPPRRKHQGVSVAVHSAGHGGSVVGSSVHSAGHGGSSVHSAASSLASASSVLGNPLVVLPSAQGAQVVNPNTHAILALEPVSFLGVGQDQADEDDELIYNEEISPVSTTAIWSTGDDDGDLYDDLRPVKTNKNKVQKNKNKKKTNKKKNNNKNKVSLNKNKKKNRRPQRLNRPRPSFNRRRPINRRGNRKRLPNRLGPIRKGSASKPNQEKRKTSTAAASNTVKRQKLANKRKTNRKSANRKTLASKRKNKRNQNIKDQGTNVFTKTETMTATGTANDDKDVNCIIIRKEPTTPRPFWNILGRDAGNVQGSGHFGKRKRAHLRFHA